MVKGPNVFHPEYSVARSNIGLNYIKDKNDDCLRRFWNFSIILIALTPKNSYYKSARTDHFCLNFVMCVSSCGSGI